MLYESRSDIVQRRASVERYLIDKSTLIDRCASGKARRVGTRYATAVTAAVAVVAALAPSAPAGPVAGPQAADGQLAQENARKEAARHEEDSAAQRERRRDSRDAFQSLSATDALQLAAARHPSVVLLPAWRAPAVPTGYQITGYETDFVARIASVDQQQLVVSNLPMRARNRAGDKRPVDLSLENDRGAYRPVNPLADVRFSERLSDGMRHLGTGLLVRPITEREPVPRLSGDALFYANALTDTDIVVRPEPTGFSLNAQIRSEASPEHLAVHLEAPEGVTLRAIEAGQIIEIRRGAEVIGAVTTPLAWDADGRHVPLSWRLHDERLEIDVPHRGRDLAYPLLVDPEVVEAFEWERWGMGSGSGGLQGWEYRASGPFVGAHRFEGGGWLGTGLYIRNLGTAYYYNAGDSGVFWWRAPGFARLKQVEWNLFEQDAVDGTCMELGIARWPATSGGPVAWHAANPSWSSCSTTPRNQYARSFSAGEPGDEAEFKVLANSSRYRSHFATQVGVVYLYVSDPDVPALSSGFPDGWVNWAPDHPLDAWAVDASTGIAEIRLSAAGWSGATLGPETYSRCQRTSMCPRAHTTDGRVTVSDMPEGINDILVSATDPSGNHRTSSHDIAVAGQGLRAVYYNNADFTSPLASRLDPVVNFNWGVGAPVAEMAADTFTARWRGYVDAPVSGQYAFQTSTDDGVRLWVRDLNQPLIDDWRVHAEASRSGGVWLAAGRHRIVLEYLEQSGEAVARLRWRPPGESAFTVVPAHRLSPPGGWQVKLDRTAPSIAIGGALHEASDAALAGDAYGLWAEVTDERADGRAAAGVRGVDITTRPVESSTATQVAVKEEACPAHSCDMELEWDFLRENYGPGRYEVAVNARDWAGNVASARTFQFEVSPTQGPPDEEEPPQNAGPSGAGASSRGSAVGCSDIAERYSATDITDVIHGIRGLEGYETTIRYGDGSYDVIHCNVLGGLVIAQHVAPTPMPDGVYMLVHSQTVPRASGSGTQTSIPSFAAADDPELVAAWPRIRDSLTALALPPTQP